VPPKLLAVGELPTVAAMLLDALTARGVLREYRGGVENALPGVGGVSVGPSPKS
jgi:hypothetical protein